MNTPVRGANGKFLPRDAVHAVEKAPSGVLPGGAAVSADSGTIAPPNGEGKPIENPNHVVGLHGEVPQEAPRRGPGRPRDTPEERARKAQARRNATPPGVRAAKRIRRNPEPPGTPQGTPGELPPKPAPDYLAIGKGIVATTETILVATWGEKWKTTPEENGMLVGATADYLKAKNLPDIPPGWLLLAVVSMYVMPRLDLKKLMEKPAKIAAPATPAPA